MKYRLIEVTKKSRVQLTVNTETTILVDVFYNEEDLEIILTKETFENLIKNYLNEIENNLNSIIKYSKEKKNKNRLC
jgi:molecular chaperone DnaK (HSP70)